ncbi:MAG: MarR family winged helix-turn-helix transcriptional regulator [Xanthobacteraceae bacterium]
MASSISNPAECNCLALRQAARRVTQIYDRFLARSGLRATQYSILARLKRNESMTINALAAELGMDRTTLGRNIRPLRRDGLVAIVKGGDDRRSKELRLTQEGHARVRAALRDWTQAQETFERAFGSVRAKKLRSLAYEAASESGDA